MKRLFLPLLLALTGIALQAQPLLNPADESLTENPRGVYRLTTIVGKTGEVISPYEQYKICTDSVTLHCSGGGNQFRISQNDKEIFNYTGETHESPMDRRPLIFNSNSRQFSLKWWSDYQGHQIYPDNDWCTENYQAGVYSDLARPFFDAILSVGKGPKGNPFCGKWRLIGMMDELKELKEMFPVPKESPLTVMVFSPAYVVMLNCGNGNGAVMNAAYHGKESVTFNQEVRKATWLTANCIALSFTVGYRTDYEVWQRMEDETPVISHIAQKYVNR